MARVNYGKWIRKARNQHARWLAVGVANCWESVAFKKVVAVYVTRALRRGRLA